MPEERLVTESSVEHARTISVQSTAIAIKKLSRNDRSWADNPSCHQNGPYVSGSLQDSDFFPKLIQRTDITHIFEKNIRTWWPELNEWKESRLVNYSNKGREYHFTGVPKHSFKGLSPASYLLIGRTHDERGEFWQCMTIDSQSDTATWLEETFDIRAGFIDGIFAPLRQDTTQTAEELLIAEILAALAAGKLAELCAAYKAIPDTASLASEAQAAFQSRHGNVDFNPFTLECPGDAVMTISRDIEFAIYKDYERRYRAAETLAILFQGGTGASVNDVVASVVRNFHALYTTFLNAGQQRKTRAGYSFEHHIKRLLVDGNVPFSEQPVIGQTRPDFILPNKKLYTRKDKGPKDVLVLSAKTTLRERWKQVIKEIINCDLYLATVDENIASAAILEMAAVGVHLVVPESLKTSDYTVYENHANVLSFRDFFRDELARNRRPVWHAMGISF